MDAPNIWKVGFKVALRNAGNSGKEYVSLQDVRKVLRKMGFSLKEINQAIAYGEKILDALQDYLEVEE